MIGGSFPRAAPLLALLLVAGCATVPPGPARQPATTPQLQPCLTLFQEARAAVEAQAATWPSARVLPGFPYLRVDRFLAWYRGESLDADAFAAWVGHLRALDREGWRAEAPRLPADAVATLGSGREALVQRLGECGDRLAAAELAGPAAREQLRRVARVPGEYSYLQRTLGLYPLTVIPVAEGIRRLHNRIKAAFATPRDELPTHGELRRYAPQVPAAEGPAAIPLRRDALGIPRPTPGELRWLAGAHAPVWEIDVAGDYDLPGAPVWTGFERPGIDPERPLAYFYPSWTRHADAVLLQLNYVIWFGERPRAGAMDLLAGALDGLNWRVTLDRRGEVLLYDVIHPCGCYHMAFPGPDLAPRAELRFQPEPPLVPARAPALAAGQRVVVRVASGSHYLESVYAATMTAALSYSLRDYAELYLVPGANGKPRGLFRPDGIVPGSERAERWLLWPMGVPEPGAMRARGRHAIAFAGHRHFADPDLIERLFQSLAGTARPPTTAPASMDPRVRRD